MEKKQITPERITKLLHLLGAWLVGLLSVDATFLLAATKMDLASWQSGALTMAAIINVPIFIGALFLLQTKFRPELQEDLYYSTYLSNRTNEPVKISRTEAMFNELEKRLEAIDNKTKEAVGTTIFTPVLSDLSFGVNINLKNRDKVISELRTLGVLGISEFGERSGLPNIMKVAMSKYIPKEEVVEILKIAGKLGFTHYGFIDDYENIKDDVLFGAYKEEDALTIVTPA